MKEIIFDNCPVKKTKLALNVNEEVMKPRSQTNLIYISPQQQHYYILYNTLSTRKTISSMKAQPHLPSDQGEVSNIIKGLNNKSTNGPDDVSAKL
jgi:hypothetical protein